MKKLWCILLQQREKIRGNGNSINAACNRGFDFQRFQLLAAIAISTLLCFTAAGCNSVGISASAAAPQPDQLRTPQYTLSNYEALSQPEAPEVHTAEDGVKEVSPSSSQSGEDTGTQQYLLQNRTVFMITPETVWEEDAVVTYNAFTLPDMAAFGDGHIGVLSVPRIGLAVNVYEGEEMEAMSKGLAHFRSTSSWDGTVGLSGHNATASGYGAYFKDLHKLEVGDLMTYTTAIGERTYKVSQIKTIADDDWSYLGRSVENRLVLITCTSSDSSKRLMVMAEQA